MKQKKQKGWISILISIVMLLSFSGCIYFGSSIDFDKLPEVEYVEGGFIWNGDRYIETEIYNDKGFILNSEVVPIAKIETFYGNWMSIDAIEGVEDYNILSATIYRYYLKEGVQLPKVYRCTLDGITLESSFWVDGERVRAKVVVDLFDEPFVMQDVLEEDYIVWGPKQVSAICRLNLRDYSSFTSEFIDLVEEQGELYIRCQSVISESGQEEHYKVKDEYQQSFREALNKLVLEVERLKAEHPEIK